MKTLDRHCKDCGASCNVKVYSSMPDGGTEAQRETAEEYAQSDWWEVAREIARKHGYADVSSCGRSGGWLVPILASGRPLRFEYSADENPTAEFDTGDWQTDDIARCNKDRANFAKFAEAVEALLESVPAMFAYVLAGIIEQDAEQEKEAQAERDEIAKDARDLAHYRATVPALLAGLQTIIKAGPLVKLNVKDSRHFTYMVAHAQASKAAQEFTNGANTP